MDKKHYAPFEKIVIRTPIFRFDIENQKYMDCSIFNEALFLASQEVYDEKKKAESETVIKYNEKLKLSLHKYYSRASTRCTPFGLFSGCSVGNIDQKNRIELEDISTYKRCTRLDMEYLCMLIQHLEQRKDIQIQLKYYPNDSIYEIGGKLRYVEYYYKGTLRVHQIVSIENSIYISKILHRAQDGATIETLINSLDGEEISLEEKSKFMHELIESQLLKSELEVQITGNSSSRILIEKLSHLKGIDDIVSALKNIEKLLIEIDSKPVGTTIYIYNKIINVIKEIGLDFQAKYLFQTDLFKPVQKANISSKIVDEIYDVMCFLNKINTTSQSTLLSNFKNAFQERYEDEEVSLSCVLDSELGIGYPIDNNGDINSLIDDLILPNKSENNMLNESILQKILLKKYIEVLRHHKRILVLSDDDFTHSQVIWDDLPETLSVMCSIIRASEGNEQLHIKFIGGTSSAACLLGRFCHLDDGILAMSRQIIEKEQNSHPDTIYAEIVHLPRSRVGNILSRPVLRPYEIHYLASSSVEIEKQIPISDLTLSLKAGRLILKSKRYNKEVMPRLTNAHNFKANSMPIYYFLCELQCQNQRNGLTFGWGGYFNQLDYLPRVMYKKHILSRERWYLRKEKIDETEDMEDDELIKWFYQLRTDRNIPPFVVIVEGDNELFINLTDPLSLRMMLSVVKKRAMFFIEEFLFDPRNAIVKHQQDVFTNEFIFNFYKK